MRKAGLAAAIALSLCGVAMAQWGAHAARFKPAAHRKPPDIEDHGYHSESLRIIAFVPSTYPDAAEIAAWPKAIVHSSWLARLEQAYGIPTNPAPVGHGFVVPSLPALPQQDSSTRSVFDGWVNAQLALHGLAPSAAGYQTIIILFQHCHSPQSLDGFGCTSHHPSRGIGIDSYALSLGDPSGSTVSQRNSLTETASHELAEAATDTGPDGWRLTAVDRDHPWAIISVPNARDPQRGLLASPDASPFLEDEGAGNIEAADLMAGSLWFEKYTPAGFPRPVRYAYVRVFSRYGNDHRDDPGVPPSAKPYFNVTTASDWYYLRLHSSKQVTVTGWSTKSLPKWSVSASLNAWEHSSARGGATTEPDPCQLSNSSFKVANDGTFTLKVSATHAAKSGTWCVVHLKSALLPAPAASGDSSHSWYVGFILTGS